MTFLKAWRSASSYRGDGSYEGWLLRIAWTQFLSDRRRYRPMLKDDEPSTPDVNAGIDLSRALAVLPERERAAALLCLGEGWSHGEATEILDVPFGTLKSLVARARARLATYLEGHSA